MKTIALVLFVCFASTFAGKLTDDQKELLRPYKEECLAETGITDGAVKEAVKSTTAESELDDKIACFSACMFKKIGFMNSEGKLEGDIVLAYMSTNLSEEILNNAVNNCKNEVGKDDCDTAKKLIKCFIKNKVQMFT